MTAVLLMEFVFELEPELFPPLPSEDEPSCPPLSELFPPSLLLPPPPPLPVSEGLAENEETRLVGCGYVSVAVSVMDRTVSFSAALQ